MVESCGLNKRANRSEESAVSTRERKKGTPVLVSEMWVLVQNQNPAGGVPDVQSSCIETADIKGENQNMTTTQTKKETKTNNQVLTPEFRVSFPAVFAPRSAMEGQEAKYSIMMLFPKTVDVKPLRELVRAAIIEKWGPDNTKWPKALRLPFRDGKEKDYDGFGPDIMFCTASSKMKPGVVDQKVQPIIEPSEFYGGCYARATITAFAYDVSGNRGVAFGLRNVQKLRDGEPFGGKSKPENDFDSIETPAAAAGGEVDPLDGIGV